MIVLFVILLPCAFVAATIPLLFPEPLTKIVLFPAVPFVALSNRIPSVLLRLELPCVILQFRTLTLCELETFTPYPELRLLKLIWNPAQFRTTSLAIMLKHDPFEFTFELSVVVPDAEIVPQAPSDDEYAVKPLTLNAKMLFAKLCSTHLGELHSANVPSSSRSTVGRGFVKPDPEMFKLICAVVLNAPSALEFRYT